MATTLLVGTITASDAAHRDMPLDALVRALDVRALLAEARALDHYRRAERDLYRRIRALLFLSDLYRYHIVARLEERAPLRSVSPARAHALLADGEPEQAIDVFLHATPGPEQSPALCTSLGVAYRQLAFVELARQVRLSVQSEPYNAFLFDAQQPQPHVSGPAPPALLCERTPVRADLTHSCWSDMYACAVRVCVVRPRSRACHGPQLLPGV